MELSPEAEAELKERGCYEWYVRLSEKCEHEPIIHTGLKMWELGQWSFDVALIRIIMGMSDMSGGYRDMIANHLSNVGMTEVLK